MCGATCGRCDGHSSVCGILGLWLHVLEPSRDAMETGQTIAAQRLMEGERERNVSPQTRGYPSEGLVKVEE